VVGQRVHRLGDVLDPVVLAREARALVRPHPAQDLERLGEPRDPHARAVVGHARLAIVGLHPAGADPELVATAREQLERRGGLREHHRVAVVDVVDERSDREARRDRGGGGERGHRLPLRVEVVGPEHRAVAERLDPREAHAPVARR
jgi:hypothetical protein